MRTYTDVVFAGTAEDPRLESFAVRSSPADSTAFIYVEETDVAASSLAR